MPGITTQSAFGKLDDGATGKAVRPDYVTGQKLGSNRIGLDAISLMAYLVSAANTAGAGSTDQIINTVAHGAKVGDIVVFQSGTQNEFEVHVDKVIDANNFELACICTASLVGASYDLLRPKTPRVDASGSTLATVSPSPIIFTRNGADQEVTEDTVTPSNNRPLPVKLTGVTGDINITAGDLNVDLDHSLSSVKIGDGTDLMLVTAAGEANVISTSANTKADALLAELQLKADLTETQPVSIASIPLPTGAATEAKQDVGNTSLSNIDGKLPATLGQKTMAASLAVVIASNQSALAVTGPLTDAELRATAVPVSGTFFQATQPISAASLPLPTGAATEAKQDAEAVLIGAVNESAPASDTASSGLNGRLQRIAQRLTSLIALFPASIGQKVAAGSLSVVLSSDNNTVSQTAMTPSFQEITSLTTVQTITAPANAKWALVHASGDNTGNIRIKFGGAASTTSGHVMEPGRSESFQAVGNLSVIAVTGTQEVCVTFGV